MEKQSKSCSILIFPWLAYSHVFPYLQLAKHLSNTKHFQLHFCSSSINLHFIKPHIHQHHNIHPVLLHVPSSPDLPPHLHTTKNLPPRLNPNLLRAFQDSAPSFSDILVALKPDLLIYDFFQPWAPKLARSHNIPAVYFATSGAAAFSFYHHLHTHGPTGLPFPHPEVYLLDHEKVHLRKSELYAKANPPVVDADEGFGFGNFELSSEIVLIKSSRGIEGKYIDHLSGLCRKKVIPTGPLVDIDNTSVECSEVSGWLSTKDRFSTVFVCFGSEHFLSKDQILEIAKGLELCEVNFVWVVRFPEEEGEEEKDICIEEELPEGFLERVRGRGRVLSGWASQGEILAHPSVGGFVSHCGWSSVMESLYFGVPIIAMPIKFDQPINGRLVAGAGAGVEVKRDDENGMFLGEEVAKAIEKVVSEECGEVMRSKARILSEKLKEEEVGAIDEVEDHLLRLCKKSHE